MVVIKRFSSAAFCMMVAIAGLAGCSTGQRSRNDFIGSASNQYEVRWISEPVTIDGDISKEIWQKAEFSVPFHNTIIGRGDISNRIMTRMKMLYDAENLYVAIDIHDNDIWATYKEHDDPVSLEEAAVVYLDPLGKGSDYFGFHVNPFNAVFDYRLETGSPHISLERWQRFAEWNATGIETAVIVDGKVNERNSEDRGWTVEMKIPFAALGVHPRPGDLWRVQVGRFERPRYVTVVASWSKALLLSVPGDFGVISFE